MKASSVSSLDLLLHPIEVLGDQETQFLRLLRVCVCVSAYMLACVCACACACIFARWWEVGRILGLMLLRACVLANLGKGKITFNAVRPLLTRPLR
jgi:hypothetical protein